MKKLLLILQPILLLCLTASAQRIMITIAGDGTSGSTGDGGPAMYARVQSPQFICRDGLGNIYFVHSGGPTIRKISYTGMISTIAGGGTSTLDAIPAITAHITPASICADAVGNVYFVMGSKIKMVNAATGILTTFAGSGAAGFSGDGGPATSAQFSSTLSGICIDPMGNMFIADKGNNRIREITGGIINTIAGTGTAGYTGDGGPATAAEMASPSYICTNALGDIYFYANSHIRRIIASSGTISTYAGGSGGMANCYRMNVNLSSVSGICFNGDGDFCWDESSCTCRRIDHLTDTVRWLSGQSSGGTDDCNALTVYMMNNTGIVSDANNNIYVTETGANRIRKEINVTSAPTFAYGRVQSYNPCAGYAAPLNSQMEIADLEVGQTETWTVLTPPANGVLTGFPATATSVGVAHTVKPTGVFYTATASYTGSDSFQIRVSDGALSDTVTVYVSVLSATPAVITGLSQVCTGSHISLSASIVSGEWSTTNTNASISGSYSNCTVTGVTAGVDTIQYTTALCPNPAIAVVTINPTPSAGTISGSDSVCVGTAITLADTAAGGVWTSSTPSKATIGSASGIVTGLSYGTANITYTVSNAWCTAKAGKSIFVNETASIISGPNPICISPTIATFSNSVPGGAWSLSNSDISLSSTGATFIHVTGVSPGIDTIYYTNTNTCGTATISKIVSVNPLPFPGTIPGHLMSAWDLQSLLQAQFQGAGGHGLIQTQQWVYYRGIVTGAATGTDSIIYTVSSGTVCANSTGVMITVGTPSAGVITGPSSVCSGSAITLADGALGGSWTVTNANASISGGGVVTGLSPGMDTVQYTVASACGSSSTTASITVDPAPDAGAITGPSNVCAGATISLADLSTGGSWSVSNSNASVSGTGVVSGITAGSEVVSYTVTNSCGTTYATVPITIDPLPDAGTISGSSSVGVGGTITITNTATGGTWSTSNGNATVSGSGVVTGVNPGTDSIIYTVTNSCGMSSSYFTITVTNGTLNAVNGISHISEFTITPNPSKRDITVNISSPADEPLTIVVSNVLGEKVAEFRGVTNHELDAELKIPAGNYFVTAISASGKATRKILIE